MNSEQHAYEGGRKVAELFRWKKGWRVYWPSRGAVEDFRTLTGAQARVKAPFEAHGRSVEFQEAK